MVCKVDVAGNVTVARNGSAHVRIDEHGQPMSHTKYLFNNVSCTVPENLFFPAVCVFCMLANDVSVKINALYVCMLFYL